MPHSRESCTPKGAFFRATSLGAVRGLQLTRVPWLDRLGFQAAHHITAMMRPFTAGTFSHVDTYNMVTNALYLGNSPSYSDDLRLFVVFPHLREDIRNNSRLLAYFWQRCMLPAIDALNPSPRSSEQSFESMDYVSHVPSDAMKSLDESLATFGLHTPNQEHGSTQALSLNQVWTSIEQTVANDGDLQNLQDIFLLVSWEAPAVSAGQWTTSSFEHFLNLDFIDQRCGKVVYDEIQEERPPKQARTRTISRKRSATLTQLEDRLDTKRTQSMDMT